MNLLALLRSPLAPKHILEMVKGQINNLIEYEQRANITTCPIASCKSIWQKWQSGKQNKTLTCPAQQVMFWAESLQCNSPLFNRVAGQVEVPTGQVSFRGSLPRSARNILESMLHPDETVEIIK